MKTHGCQKIVTKPPASVRWYHYGRPPRLYRRHIPLLQQILLSLQIFLLWYQTQFGIQTATNNRLVNNIYTRTVGKVTIELIPVFSSFSFKDKGRFRLKLLSGTGSGSGSRGLVTPWVVLSWVVLSWVVVTLMVTDDWGDVWAAHKYTTTINTRQR